MHLKDLFMLLKENSFLRKYNKNIFASQKTEFRF